MQLDNATIKRLRGIGHDLKPIVMIGNKGITPTITEEIDRALSDHELIKVKLPAGTKEERDVIGAELAKAANASLFILLVVWHCYYVKIQTPTQNCLT